VDVEDAFAVGHVIGAGLGERLGGGRRGEQQSGQERELAGSLFAHWLSVLRGGSL